MLSEATSPDSANWVLAPENGTALDRQAINLKRLG